MVRRIRRNAAQCFLAGLDDAGWFRHLKPETEVAAQAYEDASVPCLRYTVLFELVEVNGDVVAVQTRSVQRGQNAFESRPCVCRRKAGDDLDKKEERVNSVDVLHSVGVEPFENSVPVLGLFAEENVEKKTVRFR